MNKWLVEEVSRGLRLPNFIQAHLKIKISLNQIKTAIENRACRVNGRPERFASYLVQVGDTIEYRVAESSKIEVIFEDPFLAIVNKPPFVVCEAEKGMLGLRLCHRIDKETSGCLLLAKTESVEQALMALFKERAIEKTYFALVDGYPKEFSGTIESPIGGKPSKTRWILEKKGKGTSLLKCYPETGRTHQIRIHMASIHLPLLGDYTYGKKFSSKFSPSRILLHAAALSFEHPIKKNRVEVNIPLPGEFYEALQ